MAPIIVIDNLVKRYNRAETNAVDGLTLSVDPGEFFAFLGPNGAGKTTTISILTTTLSLTSGSVSIAGYDVVRQANAVRRNVGIIFQRPSFDLNLTAEENVRFHAVLYGLYPFRPSFSLMPRSYKEQVRALSELLGIESEMSRPMKTFSGGMKRKLEIVRGLIHRPRVLFLDEPTVGLDPSSRRGLWEYLNTTRLDLGTTIFLTTHYLDEAEGADRICIVNQGKIVSLGTPARVKSELVEAYVLLDAAPEDRDALAHELQALGLQVGEPPFRVDTHGPGLQTLLKSLRTPLTRIDTHTPTLEDAYLSIVMPREEVPA